MAERKKMSVIITTRNAERVLKMCLDSLQWADEVIVIDNFSTDKTPEICQRYPNVRFSQHKEKSLVLRQNYGYSVATGDWLMYHESDEIVPEALANEIKKEVLEQAEALYDGYYIKDISYMFGKWIRSDDIGSTGMPKLFKKGCLWFEGKYEHESPKIEGRWGTLRNYVVHYRNPTITQLCSKIAEFAEIDAEKLPASETESWSALYIAYRTFKAFWSTLIRGRMWRYGGYGIIFSMVLAYKFFIEHAAKWNKVYKWKLGFRSELQEIEAGMKLAQELLSKKDEGGYNGEP